MVNEKQLKPLLNALPKIPQYVSKKNHEKFQLVKPWNILLPASVIHQTWEEPNEMLGEKISQHPAIHWAMEQWRK